MMTITWIPRRGSTVDPENSPEILAMIEDCVRQAWRDGYAYGVSEDGMMDVRLEDDRPQDVQSG